MQWIAFTDWYVPRFGAFSTCGAHPKCSTSRPEWMPFCTSDQQSLYFLFIIVVSGCVFVALFFSLFRSELFFLLLLLLLCFKIHFNNAILTWSILQIGTWTLLSLITQYSLPNSTLYVILSLSLSLFKFVIISCTWILKSINYTTKSTSHLNGIFQVDAYSIACVCVYLSIHIYIYIFILFLALKIIFLSLFTKKNFFLAFTSCTRHMLFTPVVH